MPSTVYIDPYLDTHDGLGKPILSSVYTTFNKVLYIVSILMLIQYLFALYTY